MDEIICLDDDDDEGAQVGEANDNLYLVVTDADGNESFAQFVDEQQQHSAFENYSPSIELIEPVTSNPMGQNFDEHGAMIVKGQEVFYITEIDDLEEQIPTHHSFPAVEAAAGSSLDKIPDEIENESNIVEPSELSEIWNDLINANQEILILLELSDLKMHILDAKKIEMAMSQIQCDFCPIQCASMKIWNHHSAQHFKNNTMLCQECGAEFKFYNLYKDHQNVHSGALPYECDECSFKYGFRRSLLVHKIVDHIKVIGIYLCPQCNFDCKSANNLKTHIATHVPEEGPGVVAPKRNQSFIEAYKDFKSARFCGFCNKSFEGNAEYRLHCDSLHPQAKMPKKFPSTIIEHRCDNCPETFINKRALASHSRYCRFRKAVKQ